MKKSLPVFLLTTLLVVYNFQSDNNVYGRSILHKKGNSSAPAVANKIPVINTLDHNSMGNTVPTLHADLYLLNPDSSVKVADGAVAQYNNSYCACVDYMDAPKFTNLNENFALLRDGHLLSIERRPIINVRDTLFFNLTQTTIRSYQFQFTTTTLSQSGLLGFLKDSYTGDSTLVDLDGFTIYNFSVTNDVASQNPSRFMMVFEPAPQGGIVPVTYSSIKAWQQDNDIALEWKVENQLNIKSYTIERSIDGLAFNSIATLSANNSSSDVYDWVDVNAISGQSFYRVRSAGTNGTIQYSQVVKVSNGAAGAHISVYPNPVKDGIIGLQITNMPKGTYQLRMLNSFGQSVATQLINHSGGSVTQTISLNKSLPKGLYELEIIQPSSSRLTYKIQYQ